MTGLRLDRRALMSSNIYYGRNNVVKRKTLSLTCSWCADDVALGLVYGLKTFRDFRSSASNKFKRAQSLKGTKLHQNIEFT